MTCNPKRRTTMDSGWVVCPPPTGIEGLSGRRGGGPKKRCSSVGVLILAFFVIPLSAPRASAQLFGLGGGETIQNARIWIGDGRVIEKGGIAIRGERIGAVGPDVKAGFLGKSYDASGKTVTPGLIDVYSALGIIAGGGSANVQSKVTDAWDAYAADLFDDALRHGVTTVYVVPRGPVGVLGTGAILSLARPEKARTGAPVKEEVALHLNLGSGQSALGRINTFNNLRRQFREALEYRKALEDYQYDLEEYEKKIKERAEKKAKEEAEKAKAGGDKKEPEKKGPERQEPAKKAGLSPAEPLPSAPRHPSPRPSPRDARDPDVDEALTEAELTVRAWLTTDAESAPLSAERADDRDRGLADAPPAPGASGETKKEEEIKKPAEPRPDRAKEVLLKALDRKLPVRIEAHRSEDILNALELAREFNLDLILEGATEAYLVADDIAGAKTPVVLGVAQRPELRGDNEFRRHLPTNAKALSKAGVRWAVGSGADGLASRFVLANAQLVASSLADAVSPLELVTWRAARFLELEGAGRVARGARADLVVWSGDPLDPASVVERVYVGGKVVYEAKGRAATE